LSAGRAADWTRVEAWLSRPARPYERVLGWALSLTVFTGVVAFLGGPIEGDAAESVYSTWAVQHGDFACAYAPIAHLHIPFFVTPFAFVAPLYPVLTGAIAAIFRVGHATPFPSLASLGPGCHHAIVAMFNWSATASAIIHTIDLAYVAWPFVVFAALYLLRSTNRRGTRWEPATLVALSLVPPAMMCVLDSFHPQDLVAMGLALASIGGFLRGRLAVCGLAMGLALATQQFSLLALIPLLVVARPPQRLRIVAWTVGATALVDVPILIATGGRALGTEVFGSSRLTLFGTPAVASTGGTVVSALGLHGLALAVLVRVGPLLAAWAFSALYARRRRVSSSDAAEVLAMVAVSLGLRLVFEENLFGYYFMALAVAVVVSDAVRGRLRVAVVWWLALTTIAFPPIPWGLYSNWTGFGNRFHADLPTVEITIALVAALWCLWRRRLEWYLPLGIVLAVLAGYPTMWGLKASASVLPGWAWQLILVPPGLALAIGPLLRPSTASPPVDEALAPNPT
jgi:hypothetical protein